MFRSLLFDLDGTLTDPFEGIANGVLCALGKRGIRVADRRALTAFIGPPLPEAFAEYYGMTPEEALAATEDFRVYYAARGIFENKPYPGIADALAALRATGKTLYVATSKPEQFAERILARFGLSRWFDGIAGATMDETRTKKADVIAYALERFGIDPSAALMVGDRRHDVLGAKVHNIPTIGVLYGFGSREELLDAGAVALAETPQALPGTVLCR